MEQLKLELNDEPRQTTVSVVDALIKDMFIPEIRRELNRASFLPHGEPPFEQLRMFPPLPTCVEYLDVGDEGYLGCNLVPDHNGDHWDAYLRVYWRGG